MDETRFWKIILSMQVPSFWCRQFKALLFIRSHLGKQIKRLKAGKVANFVALPNFYGANFISTILDQEREDSFILRLLSSKNIFILRFIFLNFGKKIDALRSREHLSGIDYDDWVALIPLTTSEFCLRFWNVERWRMTIEMLGS